MVGGVLQVLIAAGMTFYALRFYRGRYGSRLPMILITLCALWVTASTLVQSVKRLRRKHQWIQPSDRGGRYRRGGSLHLRPDA